MIHGRSKPKFGAQLNYGNPLSRGLICSMLMNENSGARINDSVASPTGKITNEFRGTPTWIGGPFGPALYCDNMSTNPDYFKLNVYNLFTGLKQATVIFMEKTISINSYDGNVYISYPQNDTTAYSPYLNFSVSTTKTAPYIINGHIGDGSGRDIFSTSNQAITLNAVEQIGMVWNGAVIRTILNGAVSTTSKACTRTMTNRGTHLYINNVWTDSSQRNHAGVVEFYSMMIWNRALSVDEISYLNAFPYAMFDSQKYWTYYSSSPIPPVTSLQTKMKIGGIWKTAIPKMVKVNGVYREITDGKIKISGDWKSLTKS